MPLVEVDGCVYDEDQFRHSHGFKKLDPLSRETIVNHIHLSGEARDAKAERQIQLWIAELRTRWPEHEFRIYRHLDEDEVTIRFHMVRPGVPNWCESGVEIIEIGPYSQG